MNWTNQCSVALSIRLVVRLLLVVSSVTVLGGVLPAVVRAEDQSVQLSDVLLIDQLLITPIDVRDRTPFTMAARLTNRGEQLITGLRWFPSILADPTRPTDHPHIEILSRSPSAHGLDLAPGEQTIISITFRVTDSGTRHYGLLVETPDLRKGVVFAADSIPHTTRPYSLAFQVRRAALYGIPIAAVIAASAMLLRRSTCLKHMLRTHLLPSVSWQSAVQIAIGAVVLVVVFNLPLVAMKAGTTGIIPRGVSWWIPYVLVPLRWIVPLLLTIWFARSRIPALHAIILLIVMHVGTYHDLWGQVPTAILVRAWVPGVLLAVFYLSLRSIDTTRMAPITASAAITIYAIVATPWFRVYVEQFTAPR
jgi:hypothetical protein